jgi:hypothetical protein
MVCFVARGDLLKAMHQAMLECEGDKVHRVGVDNLYFYNRTSVVQFISDGTNTLRDVYQESESRSVTITLDNRVVSEDESRIVLTTVALAKSAERRSLRGRRG